MHVIVRPAQRMNKHSIVLANTRGISPHPRLQFLRNNFAAILRAEHDVNRVLRIRVGHSVAPTALGLLYIMPPALPGWASLCRAYGALNTGMRGVITSESIVPDHRRCVRG